MLAMVWSGAAAALAGPVSIRTSESFSSSSAFNPAAIVQADWQPVTDVEPLIELASHLGEVRAAWFPDDVALASSAPAWASSWAPQQARPAAIMIPLPAPAWIGVAGLGCVAFVARVINPCLRQWRTLR
jgi:hypothetical protein